MKAKVFLAAFLSLAAIVSCQKNENITAEQNGNVTAEKPSGSHTVSIRASLSGATKTTITQDSEGHFKGAWEAGDVLYVKEWVVGTSSADLGDIESSSSFVQTEPLGEGGETALFKATFDSYYWESTYTAEELATYTFTYTYLACSFNPYYMHGDYGNEYIPLMISPDQSVYSGGYDTSGDMLVSRFSTYSARPAEISFNFARLGTVVKMTIAGLQEGDMIKEGTWYTGDKLISSVMLEDIISYYPESGKYVYEVPDALENYMGDCHQVNFSCTDPSRPVVANSDGEAVLYLRVLPGVCDDWFGVVCTIDRGGSEMKYSKMVSLSDLGRSLTFKDGGLTMFSVDVKPAVVALPDPIVYAVPKPRTGFKAMWLADPHATGYECYYQREDGYDYDSYEDIIYSKVSLTPVMGTGELSGMYYVEVPDGLEPDVYHLFVRAIPDSDSSLSDFAYAEKELYVGMTKYIDWPNVDSYGSTTTLEKMGSIWKVTQQGDEYFPWYFNVTNLKSQWGYLFCDDNSLPWTLSSCTEPSLQHDGEIDHITLKMSNNRENTATVYGISPDGTATEIPQPESKYWSSSEKYYDYDFTVGSYNGFRIESGGNLQFTLLRIYFYPPCGD